MSTPVSSWGWAQCPVFDVTLQDRCGTAGQRPEPHQRVRSISEEGNTEQIGLIYSIIPTVLGLLLPAFLVFGAFLPLLVLVAFPEN